MSRGPGGRSVSAGRWAQTISAGALRRTWPDACAVKRGFEVSGLAILIGPLQHLSNLRTPRRRNNGELRACPDTGIKAARDVSGCVVESVNRRNGGSVDRGHDARPRQAVRLPRPRQSVRGGGGRERGG